MEFFKESSIDFEKEILFTKNAIGNNKYIIFYSDDEIYIYIVEKNKAKEIFTKSYPYDINQLKMNEINENII